MKHGKPDLRTMANIGPRCTAEVAEGCILGQNCPLIPFLLSAGPADLAITVDFGLEVERRSTPHKYTANGTPPFET